MLKKAKLGVEIPEKREKELKNKFVRELAAARGQWTVAAKNSNVTIARVRQWMADDTSFAEAIYEVDQLIVDEVEQALLAKIKKGDVTAMCFYLKCKGKERGYVERDIKYAKKAYMKELESELSRTEFKMDFGE